jgi:hypothetical protein
MMERLSVDQKNGILLLSIASNKFVKFSGQYLCLEYAITYWMLCNNGNKDMPFHFILFNEINVKTFTRKFFKFTIAICHKISQHIWIRFFWRYPPLINMHEYIHAWMDKLMGLKYYHLSVYMCIEHMKPLYVIF